MRTPPNSPATFAGRGLLLRAANGPFGRALIGVALGLALAGAQQGGWFRQADFSALDAANALVHPLWEPAPVVVVAGPSQAADATLRAAALQATLDAGASAVGFDETFLHPRDAASPKEGGALLALATDPRCVVARTRPNASGGPGAVRPRLATVERFVQDGGRARSVTPRLSWSGPETAGGFVYQTTVRAAAGYPRTGGAWRRIQRALAALESRDGMLIDYALRPPPLQATTLEAIASAPLPALRERVHGRVVLLSG
ncbi:MAG: hypothetical protein FJX74_06960, partial [Armatimonadetes bacterium]|nr:hypothetical protein [Armatimonadota bacterium]